MSQEIIRGLKEISEAVEKKIAEKVEKSSTVTGRDDAIRRYLAARDKIQGAIAELLRLP